MKWAALTAIEPPPAVGRELVIAVWPTPVVIRRDKLPPYRRPGVGAGRRRILKFPIVKSAVGVGIEWREPKPVLDCLFQFLRCAERDFLARGDLQRLACGRVTSHASVALADL